AGRREVDDRLRVVQLHQPVPFALERRPEYAADLAGPAVEADLHAAARASRPGFTRATAVRKTSSFGPMPDAEIRSGSSRSAQSSDTAAASTASISAISRSVVSSSVSVTIDFPSR